MLTLRADLGHPIMSSTKVIISLVENFAFLYISKLEEESIQSPLSTTVDYDSEWKSIMTSTNVII